MSEPHRLSYIGETELIETFLAILTRHNLGHTAEPMPPKVEPGASFDAGDSLSIVARGNYDSATADIAAAIAEFDTAFPARANIRDLGSMPSGGTLTFQGNRELIDELEYLLTVEHVEISEPYPDDDWVSIEDQLTTNMAGDSAIKIRVLGSGDLPAHVSTAVAALLRRHPGQAQISFDALA